MRQGQELVQQKPEGDTERVLVFSGTSSASLGWGWRVPNLQSKGLARGCVQRQSVG